MSDREFYDRERNRNRDWDRGDRSSNRDRESNWERDRWENRPDRSSRQQFDAGDEPDYRRRDEWTRGEWGRENRFENQYGREQDWDRSAYDARNREREFQRGRESNWTSPGEDRWRDRHQSDRAYTGSSENYQRGGSGSEGGYGHESSYGGSHDFSTRGGGTGLRNSPSWSVRSRERDLRNDYSFGGGMGGGMGSAGYADSWGGGVPIGVLGSGTGHYPQPSRQGGRFSGRGPKNWRRPDDRIREDLNERLTAHPDIDASEIEVQVNQCEVILMGAVDNRQEKRIAEDIADNVPGVKEVRNNLRVQRFIDRGNDRDPDWTRDTSVSTTTGNAPTSPLGLNQASGEQRPNQQNKYAGVGQEGSSSGQNKR